MATTSSGMPGHLGLLVDEATKQRFLVGCGSVFSILSQSSSTVFSGPKIIAADRTHILCWGVEDRHTPSARPHVPLAIPLADVTFPMVGANFLSSFNLKINLNRMQLEHGVSHWLLTLAALPGDGMFTAIRVRPVDLQKSSAMEEATRSQSGTLPSS